MFELSRPQGNFYGGGGGATDLNPIYPRLSSGDINIEMNVNHIYHMFKIGKHLIKEILGDMKR